MYRSVSEGRSPHRQNGWLFVDVVIKSDEIVEISLAAPPVQLSDDLVGLTNGLIRASDVHGLAFLPKVVLHGTRSGVDVTEDISGVPVIRMIREP